MEWTEILNKIKSVQLIEIYQSFKTKQKAIDPIGFETMIFVS